MMRHPTFREVFELVGISNFLIWSMTLYYVGFRFHDWRVYAAFWIFPVLLLTPLLYYLYRWQAQIEAQRDRARRQHRIIAVLWGFLGTASLARLIFEPPHKKSEWFSQILTGIGWLVIAAAGFLKSARTEHNTSSQA
jgi:hypothetical protein